MAQVGKIEYIAGINSSGMARDARNVEGQAEGVSRSFAKIATVAKVAAVAAGAAVVAGMTKAAHASWGQVAAVEQATVGLRAYEKDGNKVNKVLEELIGYARSDMGVLFNRKDLFQSAQMLKLNGVETGDLSKNVQILSRSVGLGLGNWDDLNSVVGRVVSTGRLTGIEFDQLTKSGFKLDKSLRNTNITTEELFKVLDKGIPVDAMEGQANTIRGLGIRMETAFRGVGDAILGVDADTSKFITGGLGDRLVKGMANATNRLKALQPIIAGAMTAIMSVIDGIPTALSGVWAKIQPVFKTIRLGFMGLYDSFMMGTNLIGTGGGWLTFVMDLGANLRWLWNIIYQVASNFNTMFLPSLIALWNTISTQFIPSVLEMTTSLQRMWAAVNPALTTGLKILGAIIGVTLIGAVWLLINGLNILAKVFGFSAKVMAVLVGWYANIISWIGNMITWVARAVVATVNFAIRARDAWNSFRQAAANAAKEVVVFSLNVLNWFRKLPENIRSAAGNFGDILYNAGRDLINGLINGIKNKFGDVKATLGDLTGKLTSWKGPMSVDKVLLKKSGQAVIDGFITGLESQYGNVQSTLGGLTNSLTVGTPSISNGSASGISKIENHIGNIYISNEVDADRFMARLTNEQALLDKGLAV